MKRKGIDYGEKIQLFARGGLYTVDLMDQRIEVFIKRIKDGRYYAASEIEWVELKEGRLPDYNAIYPLRLDPEDAQKLMDTLWSSGVRPVEAAGSIGQLKTMEKHLNDMRRIVAKKVGVEL